MTFKNGSKIFCKPSDKPIRGFTREYIHLNDYKPMSRVLKFRTWDTQNKEFSEWTNRDPFFSTSHGQFFFWERTQKDDGSYGGDIILEDHKDRFILQQFTGFQDASGRDIYEKDIVELSNNIGTHRYEVRWYSSFGCWICFPLSYLGSEMEFYCTAPVKSFLFNPTLCERMKILGNACENPELLNQ